MKLSEYTETVTANKSLSDAIFKAILGLFEQVPFRVSSDTIEVMSAVVTDSTYPIFTSDITVHQEYFDKSRIEMELQLSSIHHPMGRNSFVVTLISANYISHQDKISFYFPISKAGGSVKEGTIQHHPVKHGKLHSNPELTPISDIHLSDAGLSNMTRCSLSAYDNWVNSDNAFITEKELNETNAKFWKDMPTGSVITVLPGGVLLKLPVNIEQVIDACDKVDPDTGSRYKQNLDRFIKQVQSKAKSKYELDWEALRKAMADYPVKHFANKVVLPTTETGQFPLFDYQKTMIESMRSDKLLPSKIIPVSRLLNGGLSFADLANFMPAEPFPKSNVYRHILMEWLSKNEKKTFGNFRIAPNRRSSKKG